MTNTILAVPGMTCSSCVAYIKKALAIPGIAGVDVHLEVRRVVIEHEPGVSTGRLIALLHEAGYAARPSSAEPPPAPRSGCCCG